jgi:hypothetical protein
MVLETVIKILIVALIVVFAWGVFKKVFKLMLIAGIILLLLIAALVFYFLR